MGENKLILNIELVPKSCFYNNLRNNSSKFEWDIIRKKSYSDAGFKCAICKADSKLNCHEKWEYDDKNKIQKLNGFIALCNDCHSIKHIGFSKLQSEKGFLDFDKLILHFCKVNNCNKEIFLKHESDAWKTWHERNKHKWKTEF